MYSHDSEMKDELTSRKLVMPTLRRFRLSCLGRGRKRRRRQMDLRCVFLSVSRRSQLIIRISVMQLSRSFRQRCLERRGKRSYSSRLGFPIPDVHPSFSPVSNMYRIQSDVRSVVDINYTCIIMRAYGHRANGRAVIRPDPRATSTRADHPSTSFFRFFITITAS